MLIAETEFVQFDKKHCGACHSNFHKTGKIGSISIIGNVVFPYICSFLPYLHHMMFLNVKLDIRGKRGLCFQVEDFFGIVYL